MSAARPLQRFRAFIPRSVVRTVQVRSFVWSSIRSEWRDRHARSIIGMAWIVLQPLAYAAMIAVVVSAFLKAKLPGLDARFAYPVFLLAGMTAWSLFAESTSRGVNAFVEFGPVLKKTAFPVQAATLICIGNSLVAHAAMLAAGALIFGLLGYPPTWKWLALLPAALGIAMLALGVSMLLGVFNVFVRDVGLTLPIAMQFLFWTTPVVYALEMMPQSLQALMAWSPLAAAVGIYQGVILHDRWPSAQSCLTLAVAATVALGLGWALASRASGDMVDAL